MKAWFILVVIGLMAASAGQGWRMGHAAAENTAALVLSAARADAIRATERASRAEASRLAAAAERDLLALALEDAAHADPDADTVALRSDSVRRLNRR